MFARSSQLKKHCGPNTSTEECAPFSRGRVTCLPAPGNPEAIVNFTRAQERHRTARRCLIIEQNLFGPGASSKIWLQTLRVSIRRQIEKTISSADVGISPREYRMRLRLTRAKWMVEHTDRTMDRHWAWNAASTVAPIFGPRCSRSTSAIKPSDARRARTRWNTNRAKPETIGDPRISKPQF